MPALLKSGFQAVPYQFVSPGPKTFSASLVGDVTLPFPQILSPALEPPATGKKVKFQQDKD